MKRNEKREEDEEVQGERVYDRLLPYVLVRFNIQKNH